MAKDRKNHRIDGEQVLGKLKKYEAKGTCHFFLLYLPLSTHLCFFKESFLKLSLLDYIIARLILSHDSYKSADEIL